MTYDSGPLLAELVLTPEATPFSKFTFIKDISAVNYGEEGEHKIVFETEYDMRSTILTVYYKNPNFSFSNGCSIVKSIYST